MRTKKAIVIGGGIAGLTCARVLSPFFESVLVIDKDERVGSATPRLGASQGSHLHVLLQRGQEILASLFPGIEDSFRARNCPRIDWANDTKWETRQGGFPRYASSVKTYSFSRPFVESCVHSSLNAQCANVSFVHAQVIRLNSDGRTIKGIELANGMPEIPCDFAVIAGGQNFPTDRVYGPLGFRVRETSLPISITYSSITLDSSTIELDGARQYYYQANPRHELAGSVLCPIEDGRVIATLIEFGAKPQPGLSQQDLAEKARMVPGGVLADALKAGRALSSVSCFHKRTMYVRRFDRVMGHPSNLIVVGDAICSLNPVFGQGMTAALIQAETLKTCLERRNVEGFHANEFHRASVRKLSTSFTLSKIGSSLEHGMSQRYLDGYLTKCRHSATHHERFLKVLHLTQSPLTLLDAATGWNVVNPLRQGSQA